MPCRYNTRGRVDDVAFHLMMDWNANEPNITNVEIGKRLNLARATVRTWLSRGIPPSQCARAPRPVANRILRRRLVRIAETTRTVVGKRLSPVRRQVTTRTVVIVPFPSVSAIVREYLQRYGTEVQPWTARRLLKEEGLGCRRRSRGPALQDQHRLARVAYCRKFLRGPLKVWMVLWSDESLFDTNDMQRTMWCRKGNVVPRFAEQGGCKVLVHAWVSVGFKKLTILPQNEKLTSASYIKHVLTPNKAMLARWCRGGGVVQQDNARCHVSGETCAWLKAANIRTMDWPTASCDLSPAEFPWSVMKPDVSQRGPFGFEELAEFCQAAFDAIPQAHIDAAVLKTQEKMKKCIETGGALV